MKRTFASDNYAGVHPEIMDALIAANKDHEVSYGADPYTERASKIFKDRFGDDTDVFFVYNGTGANVLGLSTLVQSFQSIICSSLAHIHVDESTAPEKFLGCKLVTIETSDGKIYPDGIENSIQRVGDQHHPQVKAISISQPTEYGTIYSIEEVKAISRIAKKHNLYFHMDGSRIANAAVSLSADFRSFTREAGVDVLSFGGTKNGMMYGEAIVFLTPGLSNAFQYVRKQGMQLHSKMRFISAQFEALLTNDLWKRNASHANDMARRLSQLISKMDGAQITQSVDANGVFVSLPPLIIPLIQNDFFFYVWNEKKFECRLMCAYDTTIEDVEQFVKKLEELLSKREA
jgi:threonine aldolase